ncbi:ATP-binding protein [Archangium violaceum]|uniref:Histidine kinase/HSP90-like ATPase domain-containing protein n=1 Tax=Archangium violaceum Cb vi76 TaxID=1406225 RepID=A0A084SKA3_9BACT|nr:ATP-binding protein [Archangium violaceum]KFA88888.1 hypothetical protein Q664_38325 [Archangium violaceum Cb vi76]
MRPVTSARCGRTLGALTNALKDGGGHPVSIRVADSGGWARLVVRDEGIGIEPDVLPRRSSGACRSGTTAGWGWGCT